MSEQTKKAILSRDEISLLLHSEEAKNNELYGNLFSVLTKLDVLKAVRLEQLFELDEKAKAALTYNKKSLIDNVKQEWYTESVSAEDPNKSIRCGLCNTPNRYLFYIRNRLNNNRLNVGSSCMTKFPGIEGYSEYKYQLSQIQKNQKTVLRRTEFHNKFPNVEHILDSSEYYFDNLPVLLPEELYYTLKDVIKRFRLIYMSYVEKGKTPFQSTKNSFELFYMAINQYNKLKIKADEFVKMNLNNPLICKREEIDWLEDNNKEHLIRKISQDGGLYTQTTITHIYYRDFIKKNYDLFNARNQSSQLIIKELKTNEFTIYFTKVGYMPYLQYKAEYKDFMLKIGCHCFFDKYYVYNSQDIIKISKIEHTIRNIESIIGYTANIMNDLRYIFLIDYETNLLYLYRKADGAIKEIPLRNFLDGYGQRILNSDEFIKNYLRKLVLSIQKWITCDTQGKQGIYDKIRRLFKEQYINSDIYSKQTISHSDVIELPKYIQIDNHINFSYVEYIKIPNSKIKNKQCDYIVQISDVLFLVYQDNRIKDNDMVVYSENLYTKVQLGKFCDIKNDEIRILGKVAQTLKVVGKTN